MCEISEYTKKQSKGRRKRAKEKRHQTNKVRWHRNGRMIANTDPAGPATAASTLSATPSASSNDVKDSSLPPFTPPSADADQPTPPPAPNIVMSSRDPNSLFSGGGVRWVPLSASFGTLNWFSGWNFNWMMWAWFGCTLGFQVFIGNILNILRLR